MKTTLVVTSISGQKNPVILELARGASEHQIDFILIGDKKSPSVFQVEGCRYYSVSDQNQLDYKLSGRLPFNHYTRKNLGYLIAMSDGAEVIIETDDDNHPFPKFWDVRKKRCRTRIPNGDGWINIYKYYSKNNIWPRGFPLELIQKDNPELGEDIEIESPIIQGLADENPDVDAIYRLVETLPVTFEGDYNISLRKNSICPFNSQNTTWFKEAFPLMYLPSYCSFRMTDIWRSLVAQRIAWTCGWNITFTPSTVWQERNEHNLLKDFKDEIPGYLGNASIITFLLELTLEEGINNIGQNMIKCYSKLVVEGYFDSAELRLLEAWLVDLAV